MEINNQDNSVHIYELVDWNKPRSVLPPQKIKATVHEAMQLTQASR